MPRPKLIPTPEKMWDLFTAYKVYCKGNPFLIQDFVGKDGYQVNRKKERCLTMEGFENYVADQPGMPMDLGDYFSNKDGLYNEYPTICSRIRKAIRQDQIEGGMAGVYNPSITQRLNNLVERSETTIKEQPLFPDVPTDNSGQ